MDLTSRYLGLTLRNPIVASASPLSDSLDMIRRLEDHGAAAVVLFSLFEEQIRRDRAEMEHFRSMGESVSESLSYFPRVDEYDVGPDQYLELIRRATEAVDIPIIGSLNGVTERGWADFAGDMQQAGASAIELNVYYIPTEMWRTGQQVEDQYSEVLAAVKHALTIPVAMKLGPYFSSVAHMVGRLDREGADGFVLFNRFYQPDFDIEQGTVVPSLALSRPEEMRLPLMWIALLHGGIRASIAASTGVQTAEHVIKYLMAGADVVMTTSALLQHGPSRLTRLTADLVTWMERKGYHSVSQLRGSMSQRAVKDSAALVRANYIRVLDSYRVPAW